MKIEKSEIVKQLKEGIIIVTFIKSNGEERVMKCTLQSELLPVVEVVEGAAPKAKRKPNDAVVSAFDVEKKEWRSFKIDSIISIVTE